MHEARTSWPMTTRVSSVVALEALRREHPGLSARHFGAANARLEHDRAPRCIVVEPLGRHTESPEGSTTQ